MKKRTICLILYLSGVLTGFCFYYIKSLCTFKENVIYKDEISDMIISTQENLGFKAINISNGNDPLITFEINKMKRVIERAGVFDEKKRMVGRFYVTDGKFDGIEMLTENLIPFFQMFYDDEMQRWHEATYCKRTEAERIIGDYNEDINIDGQFDLIQNHDKLGNYTGNMAFFNNSWHPVVDMSEDGLSVEIVSDIEKKELLKLSFDFKKGWVPDSMKDLSRGDKNHVAITSKK
jgi:hypothetical protein